MTQHPTEPRLAALLRAVFQVAYVERDLFAIAQTGGRGLPGRPLRTTLADAFVQVLSEANVRGELADRDPELLAALLTGLVTQGVQWWLDHDQPGPEAMADQVLQLISDGLPSSRVLTEAPSA